MERKESRKRTFVGRTNRFMVCYCARILDRWRCFDSLSALRIGTSRNWQGGGGFHDDNGGGGQGSFDLVPERPEEI